MLCCATIVPEEAVCVLYGHVSLRFVDVEEASMSCCICHQGSADSLTYEHRVQATNDSAMSP